MQAADASQLSDVHPSRRISIGIFTLMMSFTACSYAQDFNGLVRRVLSGRTPTPQNVVNAIRSIPDVSHGQVAGGAQLPAGEYGQVVLYRTEWCTYCRRAAAHMRRKGIPFIERDIEVSELAHAEYLQYGGTGGVPLLVFGQRTMRGFSAAHFDFAYARYQDDVLLRAENPSSHSSQNVPDMLPKAGDVLVGKIAGVLVYEQPVKSSQVMTTLQKSDEVVFMGEESDGLYRVTTPSGNGWTDKLLLKKR